MENGKVGHRSWVPKLLALRQWQQKDICDLQANLGYKTETYLEKVS